MYGDALAAQRSSVALASGLDSSWSRHLHFQHLCFKAVALWWRGKELSQQAVTAASAAGPAGDTTGLVGTATSTSASAASLHAERVACLRAAKDACDRALAPPDYGGAAATAASAAPVADNTPLAPALAAQAQGLKGMVGKELVQAQLDLANATSSSLIGEDSGSPNPTDVLTSSEQQLPPLAEDRRATAVPFTAAAALLSITSIQPVVAEATGTGGRGGGGGDGLILEKLEGAFPAPPTPAAESSVDYLLGVEESAACTVKESQVSSAASLPTPITTPTTTSPPSTSTTTSSPRSFLPFSGVPSKACRQVLAREWEGLHSDAQRSARAAFGLGSAAKQELSTLGLPLSLEVFLLSQGIVPDALWERVAAWQNNGGADALHAKMLELDGVADACMQAAGECGGVLGKEDASSMRFLTASEQANENRSERVGLCQAACTQLAALQGRLAKLNDAWVGGREADEKLRLGTLGDQRWLEGAGLLALAPKEALAAELKRTNTEAQQAQNQAVSAAAEAKGMAVASAAAAASSTSGQGAELPSSPGKAKALKQSLLDNDDGETGGGIGGGGGDSSDFGSSSLVDQKDRVEALQTAALQAAEPLGARLESFLSLLEARDAAARDLAASLPEDPFGSGVSAGGHTSEQVAIALSSAALKVARARVGGGGVNSGDEGNPEAALLAVPSSSVAATESLGLVGGTPLPLVRSCISFALEPLREKIGRLDASLTISAPLTEVRGGTASEGSKRGECSSDGGMVLSNEEQGQLLAQVKALHGLFSEARQAYTDAAAAVAKAGTAGGSSGAVNDGAAGGRGAHEEHERRVALLEATLSKSTQAFAHLEQGMGWYGDLAR